MLAVVALGHGMRRRGAGTPLIVAGAIILAGAGWICLGGLPGGAGVASLFAVACWTLGYVITSRGTWVFPSVGIGALFVFVTTAAVLVLDPVLPRDSASGWIVNTLGICVSAAAIAAAVARKGPGRHYFMQAAVFMLLHYLAPVAEYTLAIQALPVWASPLAMVIAIASMFYYQDAISLHDPREDSVTVVDKAFCYDVASAALKKLEQVGGATGADFENYARAFAETLIDGGWYTRIFLGREDKPRGRCLFTDEFLAPPEDDTSSYGVITTFSLPSAVCLEAFENGRSLLVESSASATVKAAFSRIGIEAAIIVPLPDIEAGAAMLLIGMRGDDLVPDVNDALRLDGVASHLAAYRPKQTLATESDAPASPGSVDTVTGVRSFTAFQQILGEEMMEADKNGTAFGLLFVDFDHYSDVNRRVGYDQADKILRDVAVKLSSYAMKGCVGRIGSDELAALLKTGADDARQLVETIVSEMNESLKNEYPEAVATMSAAYTIYPIDFCEQTAVFGKLREMLSSGDPMPGHIVRVKVG